MIVKKAPKKEKVHDFKKKLRGNQSSPKIKRFPGYRNPGKLVFR